jgi:hypothetical protein
MPAPEPGDNTRGKVAALVVILLLLASGWWLVQTLGNTASVQDCVAAGHRDCGGTDTNAH